ncbi:hypothetical protein HY409_00965, partial [Candidatus Gottesmanbacteria bacterium]|nr:hypothetical protein [Candidatus Gottesmanbacteria bacterium]
MNFYPSSLTSLGNSKKSLWILLVLLIVTPFFVWVALRKTPTPPKASSQQTIATVKIDPGQITTSPSGSAIHMSALAVDSNGNQVNDARYQWGMSSTNSIGTVIQEKGNEKLATFTPSRNRGQGDIWVRAINSKGKKTRSIPVYVGVQPPSPTPTPVGPHKVSWSTEFASLFADDFKIIAGNKTFYGTPDPNTTVSVGSDPPTSGDPNYTTLEVIWTEQAVDMRLFIYFYKDNNKWWASEIRTYDGSSLHGGWIYYRGTFFRTDLGKPYRENSLTLRSTASDNNISGSIKMSNATIQGFANLVPTPTPTRSPTPTPTRRPTSTPTPTRAPTATPTPVGFPIEFRQQFTGVSDGSAQGAMATARFVKSGVNFVTSPFALNHIGGGVYSAILYFTGQQLPPGSGYTIIIKGEKHVARKFCKLNQTTPCQGNEPLFTIPSR